MLPHAYHSILRQSYCSSIRRCTSSNGSSIGSSLASSSSVVLACSPLTILVRERSSTIRIANRKKVEMFVGKRFHLPTRLRVAAPEIAAEWDHAGNPKHLYPEIIGIGYMYPVRWKCSSCLGLYEMSVEKRVVRGGGCPHCEEAVQQKLMEENTMTLGNLPNHRNENTGEDAAVKTGMELLPGEQNKSLRPKRSTMLNIRTKY